MISGLEYSLMLIVYYGLVATLATFLTEFLLVRFSFFSGLTVGRSSKNTIEFVIFYLVEIVAAGWVAVAYLLKYVGYGNDAIVILSVLLLGAFFGVLDLASKKIRFMQNVQEKNKVTWNPPAYIVLAALVLLIAGYFMFPVLSLVDPQVCAEAKDAVKRDSCYAGFAISNNDSSLCDKVESDLKKQACHFEVDPAYCENQGTQIAIDSCYDNMAVFFKNPALCEKLRELDNHYCLAVSKMDPALCASLSGEEKDICYRNIGATKKQPSLCDNIVDPSLKADCYTNSQ